MDLKDYAAMKGGTGTLACPVLKSIAGKAGCSAGTLYQIALGNKPAGPKLANAIHRATRGAVSRVDLRPDLFGPASKARANKAA